MTGAEPSCEEPLPPDREGFTDAVTVAFGDPAQALYGLARVGLAHEGGGRTASGLAILFAGGAPAVVRAEGGVDAPRRDAWAGVAAAGVRTEVVEPQRRWRAELDAGDEGGFALELEARCAPLVLEAEHPVARSGGMSGYDQLCAVRGTVRAGGRELPVDGLGQRARAWGAPDWSRLALTRTLSGWLDESTGFSAAAVRPAKAQHHGDEALAAHLVVAGHGEPVDEPRLSTTLDADGRQRHAGLELLWDDEERWPHRAAGAVLCGTTLELGRLRLDAAFFRWWMDGRSGVGRYDVLRRA